MSDQLERWILAGGSASFEEFVEAEERATRKAEATRLRATAPRFAWVPEPLTKSRLRLLSSFDPPDVIDFQYHQYWRTGLVKRGTP